MYSIRHVLSGTWPWVTKNTIVRPELLSLSLVYVKVTSTPQSIWISCILHKIQYASLHGMIMPHITYLYRLMLERPQPLLVVPIVWKHYRNPTCENPTCVQHWGNPTCVQSPKDILCALDIVRVQRWPCWSGFPCFQSFSYTDIADETDLQVTIVHNGKCMHACMTCPQMHASCYCTRDRAFATLLLNCCCCAHAGTSWLPIR